MTTSISPHDYCKNPNDYKNDPSLTDKTKLYWNQFCQLQKDLGKAKMPSNKNIGQCTDQAFSQMIAGIFTPQGLEMLSIISGAMILGKTAKAQLKKILGSWVKNGLSEAQRDAVKQFVKDGGDYASANSGAIIDGITQDLVYVDVEVAEAAGYSGGRFAVSELLVGVADIIGKFVDFAMAVQLLGMVLDAWDPCNLNEELDATALKQMTLSFDSAFRTSMAISIQSTKDSYGNITLNETWPIEYYAEKSALIPFKNDYYGPRSQYYISRYLNTLQLNSNGSPIFHEKGGRAITNEDVNALESQLTGFLSDGNTVIQNWIIKWWPLLIGIVILIIVIFVYIRKRNV